MASRTLLRATTLVLLCLTVSGCDSAQTARSPRSLAETRVAVRHTVESAVTALPGEGRESTLILTDKESPCTDSGDSSQWLYDVFVEYADSVDTRAVSSALADDLEEEGWSVLDDRSSRDYLNVYLGHESVEGPPVAGLQISSEPAGPNYAPSLVVGADGPCVDKTTP
jgi:hypothetical protein